jgi:hypothetical protein
MNSTRIYTCLTITSFVLIILELLGIFIHNQAILLPDIGHVLAHGIIAPWGLYLSTLKNSVLKNNFRRYSVGLIGIVSLISVLVSVLLPSEHTHHTGGIILLGIAIISIIQHRITHAYHDHSGSHDILCSGLYWHTLADSLKSLIFAGMFFAGLFINIEPFEGVLIWIVRGIIVINAIILIHIFFKPSKNNS